MDRPKVQSSPSPMKDFFSAEMKSIIVPLLDFFSSSQNLVIAMYTGSGRELWTTHLNLVSPLCEYMRSRSDLWALCHLDHALRSSQTNFGGSQDPKPSTCHLGLWNLAHPISYGGIYYGALITGQRMLRNPEAMATSDARFYTRIEELKNDNVIDSTTEAKMREIFSSVQQIDSFPADSFKALAAIERSLIGVISDLLRRVNRITLLRHEIHQPNTAARGILCESRDLIADILSAQPTDIKAMRQKLENTLQNVKYAISNSILFSTIVENICSSLSADGGVSIPRRCNLPNLLIDAQRIFEGPAGDKDVIFDPIVKTNLDVPTIYADQTLLMRAFMNVYHNAVKYSYYGQGEDRPRRIQTTCEGLTNSVKITIANYGIGILPDETNKVFRENYRGKLSADRHRTGSGLGLYQVKRIIDEQHAGKTEIESRPLTDKADGPYLTKIHIFIPYSQNELEVR